MPYNRRTNSISHNHYEQLTVCVGWRRNKRQLMGNTRVEITTTMHPTQREKGAAIFPTEKKRAQGVFIWRNLSPTGDDLPEDWASCEFTSRLSRPSAMADVPQQKIGPMYIHAVRWKMPYVSENGRTASRGNMAPGERDVRGFYLRPLSAEMTRAFLDQRS